MKMFNKIQNEVKVWHFCFINIMKADRTISSKCFTTL